MPSETALREPSPPDPSPLRPALPRASGERTNSVLLMASRILSRFRAGEPVELDVQGEIQNNQFHFREAAPTREAEQGEIADGGLGKLAAMEQAGNDVTKVFRVGKGYRFSVYDHACDEWQDSPLVASREEAELLRQQAFKARFEALQKGGN